MTDQFEIKVWAQMFFKDGSVSEGRRYPADILDDQNEEIRQIAVSFLQSVGRSEGLLVIWGADNLLSRYVLLTSSVLQDESQE